MAVHRRAANRALALGPQQLRLALLVLVHVHGFVAGDQVHGVGAAFRRRQGVAGTAEEDAGAAGANLHHATAFVAFDASRDRRVGPHATLGVCLLKATGKVAVELVEQPLPRLAAVGDLVEVSLHAGGEGVVEQVREVLHEPVRDQLANLLGMEAPVLQRDVAAVLDRGDDGGVGGRPADAALLQLAHETRLAVAGRRLGEVLHGLHIHQRQGVALAQVRQRRVVIAPKRLHHAGEAVEAENAAPDAQLELAAGGDDGGRKILRRRHLRCHEATPDEVVEADGIGFDTGKRIRRAAHIGRADGFVGFLRRLLAGVGAGRLRQVAFAVLRADVVAYRTDGFAGNVGGVGAHVGDVSGFVEPLGQRHRAADAEAEPGGGSLLQCRGDERCARP